MVMNKLEAARHLQENQDAVKQFAIDLSEKVLQDSGVKDLRQIGLTRKQEQAAIKLRLDRKFRSVASTKPDEAQWEKIMSGMKRLDAAGKQIKFRVAEELQAAKREQILSIIKCIDVAGEQAKLRAALKESKEFFLRGQFLNQVMQTGTYNRKAATAEDKAKYNPYAEEERRDLEADQRRKEAAEITPVAVPTDDATVALEEVAAVENQPDRISTNDVSPNLQETPISIVSVPTVERDSVKPAETPALDATAVVTEASVPTPAPELTAKIFLPSHDDLPSDSMGKAPEVAGSKVLPGIKALGDVEKQLKLRAAKKDESIASTVSVSEVVEPEKTNGQKKKEPIKHRFNPIGRWFDLRRAPPKNLR